MASASIQAVIGCEIHRVWEAVLAVEKYGAWRSDLSRAEATGPDQFVEYGKNGSATHFSVARAEPPRRWELDMENGLIKGHWTGAFTPRGSETQIDFTERVTAKAAILRPFVKRYLKKQQAQFVQDLKRHLER